jgi:anaerobic magnesium-protoporphyrin IX monomethyl ester cyclase
LKILLLNPPFLPKFSRSQRSPGVIKSGVMYYPIWLAYATGVLEKSDFQVKLVDAPAQKLTHAHIQEIVETLHPRLIVLDTSTPSIFNDLKVAEEIKSYSPDTFITLVGPHVSALPEETLLRSSSINAVAIGEYDYTLRDLAMALDGGDRLDGVSGLCFRDPSTGEIVRNPSRPYIQDLDELPFVSEVYKRHLRVEDYFYSITLYPEVAIITGRGCPYQCTYCVWPQTLTGHEYRCRSVTNVADEFDFIARELPQVKEIFIEDDTLTVNSQRSTALSRELLSRDNRIVFSANSRADISEPVLRSLKESGLRLVCVGFESGDQTILNGIQKGIKVENYKNFREAARKAGVLVHGCFMAGNPGETRQTLQKTLDLALMLNPDTAQFFPMMIYPGTKAFQRAKNEHTLSTENYQEWLTEEGLHRSILQYKDLSGDDLVAWCNQARKKFYLRPGYVLRNFFRILLHPTEGRRILKAAKTFFRYLWKSA